MKENNEYLFVYGTLRKAFDNPMAKLLRQEADYEGEGVVDGKLYDIGRFPGAIISCRDSIEIKGEIYALRIADRIFAYLDQYEGYSPNIFASSLFRREKCQVTCDDGDEIEAWIYIFNEPLDGYPLIERGDYVEFINNKGDLKSDRAEGIKAMIDLDGEGGQLDNDQISAIVKVLCDKDIGVRGIVLEALSECEQDLDRKIIEAIVQNLYTPDLRNKTIECLISLSRQNDSYMVSDLVLLLKDVNPSVQARPQHAHYHFYSSGLP